MDRIGSDRLNKTQRERARKARNEWRDEGMCGWVASSELETSVGRTSLVASVAARSFIRDSRKNSC